MADAAESTELIGVFPHPVLRARLPNSEWIAPELEALILAERNRSHGLRRSNRGGWHSHQVVQNWREPCAGLLIEQVRALAREWISRTSPDLVAISSAGWSVKAWASVNTRGASFRRHTHLRSQDVLLSGVYYVNAGTSGGNLGGELVFERPGPASLVRVRPKIMDDDYRVRPETGMLLLFPSWLPHRVEPYLGEGQRISVGFNISHDRIEVRWHPVVRAGLSVARRLRRVCRGVPRHYWIRRR